MVGFVRPLFYRLQLAESTCAAKISARIGAEEATERSMNQGRMSEESLRELLAKVHERLSQSGSIDEESRKLLGALVQDIGRALGQGPSEGGAVSGHAPRLEALAVRFEADHPALAELLRQLTDALGKLGI